MQTAPGPLACELYCFPCQLIHPPHCAFALLHAMRNACSLTVAEKLDLHVLPATTPRVTIKPLVASLRILTCFNVWWIQERWERLNNMFVSRGALPVTTAVSWTRLGSVQVLWGRSEMLLNVRNGQLETRCRDKALLLPKRHSLTLQLRETQFYSNGADKVKAWQLPSVFFQALSFLTFHFFISLFWKDKNRWVLCIALHIKC